MFVTHLSQRRLVHAHSFYDQINQYHDSFLFFSSFFLCVCSLLIGVFIYFTFRVTDILLATTPLLIMIQPPLLHSTPRLGSLAIYIHFFTTISPSPRNIRNGNRSFLHGNYRTYTFFLSPPPPPPRNSFSCWHVVTSKKKKLAIWIAPRTVK